MTTAIDSAVARLQDIAGFAGAKHAPDFPIDDAGILPLSIAHVTGGQSTLDDATQYRNLCNISVDVHFSRISLRKAYQDIDAFVSAFLPRIAADPTLNGAVDTIIWPVNYTVGPAQWDKVTTQMLSFTVPVKILEIPVST